MKLHWTAALPMAATLLFTSSVAHAQAGVLAQETPATVVLNDSLDQAKLKSGGAMDVRLTHNVKLSNGTELHKGARLVGTVAEDDMQTTGTNKMAIRFTGVQEKGGKTVPVKATIIAVSTEMMPVAGDPDTIEANIAEPRNLNGQNDRVDEVGVTSGVDLHSNATSSNSGVFVSEKSDIKLPRGTKMELAIAPAQ